MLSQISKCFACWPSDVQAARDLASPNQLAPIPGLPLTFGREPFVEVPDSGISMISSVCRGLSTSGVGPCMALASHYADSHNKFIGLAHVDGANFANEQDIRDFVAATIDQYRKKIGDKFSVNNLHFSLLIGKADNHIGAQLDRPLGLQRSIEEVGATVTTVAFPNESLLVTIDTNGQCAFLRMLGGDDEEVAAAVTFTRRYRVDERDDQLLALCSQRLGSDLCAVCYMDADLDVAK